MGTVNATNDCVSFFGLVARKPRAKLQPSTGSCLEPLQTFYTAFIVSFCSCPRHFYIWPPTRSPLRSQYRACSMLGAVRGWTHSNFTPLKILVYNLSPLIVTVESSNHRHWETLPVVRFREGSGGLFLPGFCHQTASSGCTPWVTQSLLWSLSHLFCHSVSHRTLRVPHTHTKLL